MRRRQPHPELNFRRGRGRRTTGADFIATCRALGMTDEEIRQELLALKAKRDAQVERKE